MHVLITGGAGFIGSHLAEYHLKKGDSVYIVDNLSTGSQDNLNLFHDNSNFQYEIADILTWGNLNEAVQWADRIYHMAAIVGMFRVIENPVNVLATNIIGYERLLRTISTNKCFPHVVLASSSSVYGANHNNPLQEDDPMILKSTAHGHWSYAISKLANESFSQAYTQGKNVPITIARFFNNIGPRQRGCYGMVVPRLIQQAIQNKPLTIYGDGHQTRSFCDVRDSVAMLDRLITNPKSVNETINLGSDREISINDLALLIKKTAQSRSEITHLSYFEAYGENFDPTPQRRPCLKKLRSFISYKNKWTLEKTIEDLVHQQQLITQDSHSEK